MLNLDLSALAALIYLTSCVAQRWPQNLARGERYYPEHEALVRQQESALARLATETPVAVRQMSQDPNDMFFMHYWQFEDDLNENPAKSTKISEPFHAKRPLSQGPVTASISHPLSPALLPIFDEPGSESSLARYAPRHIFDKRNYQCPSGTNACTSISRPNSCCAANENCVIVSSSGSSGDVGCCPQGQTCGGQVASCDTGAGYTSCPNSSNGGCCIPGYTCQDIGCVASGYTTTTELYVVTITVSNGQTSPVVVTSTASPHLTPVLTVVTVQQTAITSIATSTHSVTPSVLTVYSTASPQISTTTVVVYPPNVVTVQGGTICATGYKSCDSSVGGGCCPTDRACPVSSGSNFCPSLNTSTVLVSTTVVGVAPPVRPTSNDGLTTTTVTTQPVVLCPTGYYQCSAYYIGGCCQVGRNCDMTSCPSPNSATLNSAGATIVVPFSGSTGGTAVIAQSVAASTSAGGSISNNQGSCANGWFQCDSSNTGAGCCPGGYTCGAANCIATVSTGNPSQVNKIGVSGAAANFETLGGVLMTFATLSGICMILL